MYHFITRTNLVFLGLSLHVMLFLQLCGPLDFKKEMAFTPEFHAGLVMVGVVSSPLLSRMVFFLPELNFDE